MQTTTRESAIRMARLISITRPGLLSHEDCADLSRRFLLSLYEGYTVSLTVGDLADIAYILGANLNPYPRTGAALCLIIRDRLAYLMR